MCQMQKWLLVKQYPALYVRTFLLLLCYIVVIYALFMQVIIFFSLHATSMDVRRNFARFHRTTVMSIAGTTLLWA